MKTCKDCLHHKVCQWDDGNIFTDDCDNFTDRSEWVQVKHGKWELCFEDWRKQIAGDKCSACGFEHYGSAISHYQYCPNCGAKMDSEEAEKELERMKENDL